MSSRELMAQVLIRDSWLGPQIKDGAWTTMSEFP
jgi:hypothetical protein